MLQRQLCGRRPSRLKVYKEGLFGTGSYKLKRFSQPVYIPSFKKNEIGYTPCWLYIARKRLAADEKSNARFIYLFFTPC